MSYLKDQDGNIVKTYCYNYEGQRTDCGFVNEIPKPEPEIPGPGNGGDLKTTFAYVNNTVANAIDGSDASEIVYFQVKDSSGNSVFDTSQSSQINGMKLSQGTYTFIFTINGPGFNPTTRTGWASCVFFLGNSWIRVIDYNASTTVYTMPNVVVSGTNASILLDTLYY